MGENSMNESKTLITDVEITPKKTVKPRRDPGPLIRRALQGVTLAILAVGVSWMTAKSVSPEVVAFDMKGTMDLFIQQTMNQKVPADQSKLLMQRFNRAMTDSLQSWQDNHNVVILVAPAVVSSQPDITQEIRNDIAARMQAGGQ
jgi:conjugal transfer pilin signal peptidase TrbI